MLKIPARIWYETDMTVNINESAHPFTNKMTGMGRPLAESIERRTADRMIFEQLGECSQRCDHLNTNITFSDRHSANRLRHESRIRTKAAKTSKEDELARLNNTSKDTQQQKKCGDFDGSAFEFPSGSISAGAFDVVTGLGDLDSTEINAPLQSALTGDVSRWDFGSFLTTSGPSRSTIPEEAPADAASSASRAATWTPWSGSMTQVDSSQPASQSTGIGSTMQSLAGPISRPQPGQVLGWSPDAA
ncbi:uncharacterized protein SCHCODRAFT_02665000 [Schizophyllum commune H4-8]|nr:uncharacterized protein SCHCODRAFT_02665000 [Schizophyllum commune H4-8]KAI5894463.1 hypothetical protein SCHCODRAFT_02665000 [Schizophyllum commune H4-8]